MKSGDDTEVAGVTPVSVRSPSLSGVFQMPKLRVAAGRPVDGKLALCP
jgi:hypothetical protein